MQYCGLFVLFSALWIIFEYKLMGGIDGFDLLSLIVGTQGGYENCLIISTIFLSLFLLVISEQMKMNRITIVTRIGRDKTFKVSFKNICIDAIAYSFAYVIVTVIFTVIFVKWKRLAEVNFFLIMAMYYVVIVCVFLLAGCLNLLLCLITNNSVLSLLIVVGANMFIACFLKKDIFYGDMTILDDMTSGNDISVVFWGINQIIKLCIIGIVCIFIKSIYEKKDLI